MLFWLKMIDNLKIYYGTIGWDGFDELSEGEYTIRRYNIDDLVEGFVDYLDQWKARNPYVVCASHEADGKEKDITDHVKLLIKQNKNRGNNESK